LQSVEAIVFYSILLIEFAQSYASMRKRLVGNKQLRADTQATRATDSTIRIEKLNQIAEDQELENLEMIYELEYKLERMAGYVSRSLDDLRGVTLTGADLENINKTRDLI
jgi:hypothetical protein